MTNEQFKKVLASRLEKSESVLGKKAVEYARGDRLSNFKRAAAALKCPPETVCINFWMKHVVSILDMVDDIERSDGALIWNTALWDEKIGDAINYLILLEALVMERIEENRDRKK